MIDDDECGAVGGMRIGRGNPSSRRKPAPVPLCSPQIPHDLTRARTRAAAVVSRRLTASRPGRTPGEIAPGTHWIGGWVSPRAGLDDVKKRLELQALGRPARSQSLYRLRYSGSCEVC
jgi:hypothetical protein